MYSVFVQYPVDRLEWLLHTTFDNFDDAEKTGKQLIDNMLVQKYKIITLVVCN